MTTGSSQGGAGSEHIGPGRVPDELIDAVLDGAADVERSRSLFNKLSTSPEAAREVASTQRAIDALKSPVRGPDLSNRVLAELACRHGFMTAAGRRKVWLGRVAAAAAVVLTVGGAFAVQRFVPEAATLVHQPTPVSDVVAAVPAPTKPIAEIRSQITCGLDELPVLSTFARVCASQDCETVVVASCDDTEMHPRDGGSTDEVQFTVVVLQRTAPNRDRMATLAARSHLPTTEQFLALGIEGAELAMGGYPQSLRPGAFDDSYAMWGPASGSAHVEPMMLIRPAAAFDWVGTGDDLAQGRGVRSGALTPQR